jgi:hypothetical protein
MEGLSPKQLRKHYMVLNEGKKGGGRLLKKEGMGVRI